MKQGIYTITNTINGKIYLGCTFDFTKRKSEHFIKLRQNIHKNKHLQSSFNKYGEGAFVFEILIECDKAFLISEEHYWANLLKVHDRKYGYNQRPTNPYGKIIHTEEMKQKFREKMIGRKLSKQSIDKRTATRKKNGYSHSQETKDLISKNSAFRRMDRTLLIEKNKLRKGEKRTLEQIKRAIDGRRKHKEENGLK